MKRSSRRMRLVLALLVLTSFTLITLDVRAGAASPFLGVRDVVAGAFGPVQRAVAAVVRPVGSALSGIPHLAGYRGEAERLARENADLRRQLQAADLDRERVAELDRLLGLAGRGRYKVVPARVVGIGGAGGFEWTATIDVGSRDGVAPDMTVVNGDGLVGRVKMVGPFSATVLLAIDGTSAVGARLEGSLQVGTLSGHGRQPMSLQLFDPQTKVAVGDRLVTLGSAGARPFVSGVPIGSIREVEKTSGALTRSALVTPYVDFGALDLVGVVVEPPREDPRDAVLPPRPAPPAAASPAPPPDASASPSPGAAPAASPTPSVTPAPEASSPAPVVRTSPPRTRTPRSPTPSRLLRPGPGPAPIGPGG